MLQILKTEEELYAEVSQFAIMEFYLGITPSAGSFTNPFRTDNSPGCTFWVSPKTGVLYFKDWAIDKSYTCMSVIMAKYDLTYNKALKRLNMDLQRIKDQFTIETASWEDSKSRLVQAVAKKKFDKWDLEYWNKYGIKPYTLNKYCVSAVKTVFLDKEPIWISTKINPVFCYLFPRSHKIKLYRPLNPDKKYKWMSSCKSDDVHGYDLYIKDKPKHNVLIITSSCKDAMVLDTLGFPSIAPQAEVVMIKDDIMDKLFRYYKYVFIFMDGDPAGSKINLDYKDKYSNIYPIQIPLYCKAKDISDFRLSTNHKKTYQLIKKLLKEAVIPRENSLPF